MLADEDEFLHAVAILFIPIATQTFVLLHESFKFVFGHGCVPLSYVLKLYLFTCLLKHIADIFFALKVADAFCPNDILGP